MDTPLYSHSPVTEEVVTAIRLVKQAVQLSVYLPHQVLHKCCRPTGKHLNSANYYTHTYM